MCVCVNFLSTWEKKNHSYVGLLFRTAGGCSASLGMHPTKVPMMWEARVGHSGVPARDAERKKTSSLVAVH